MSTGRFRRMSGKAGYPDLGVASDALVGQAHDPAGDADELVAVQGLYGLGVELRERPCRLGHEAQRAGAALAERALEPGLLA